MAKLNGCLQVILIVSVSFLVLYLLQGITTGNLLQKKTNEAEEEGIKENMSSYHQNEDFQETDNTSLIPENTSLSPYELLPYDSTSSETKDLGDVSFLPTPERFVGVNTISSSLRNANLQLRSEPPNPQTMVCPWMQSTIKPDLERKPLEGCGY